MEPKNMELHNLYGTNEEQLRHMVKHLTVQLEKMKHVNEENCIVRTKNNMYKLREEEYSNILRNDKSLKKEILELRKQLKITKELSQSWKDEREHFLKLEEQLHHVTKERDVLRQLLYKEEGLQLMKKNRDLKVAMSKQEKQLMEKTHVLELEVEKLQEKTSKLQEKNDKLQEEKNKLQDEKSIILAETSKDHKHELAQKQRALIVEKRCSDLEEQLERALKELRIKLPPNKWTEFCLEKPFDMAVLYDKHRELAEKLMAERNRRERNDHIIKEKEKQNEELKLSMSKLLPCEMNPKSQKVFRVSQEQSSKISSLMAQVEMFQLKAEEDKREGEKLVEKVKAIKKKYLKEKMQNTDLREALRRSGAKQAPEEKPGAVQAPPTSHGSHAQSREERVDTEMQTAKLIPAGLPPISNKSRLESGVKPGHARSAIGPKKVVLKSGEKSYLPITKKINDQSKGKSSCRVLPPISKSSQKSKI